MEKPQDRKRWRGYDQESDGISAMEWWTSPVTGPDWFAGNIMSVFTDCPGREKLSCPADYTMPMGAVQRNFELGAYLRTTMRHLVEGQSIADTPMRGNVALKTPVYDWGYSGRFGDEINWGNAIILVPWMLYDQAGDTETMARYYDRMVAFADYVRRQKADANHIVDAALADWVTADGNAGTTGATRAAQALTLDAGLVPEGERAAVLDALVELVHAFHPDGDGPYFSAGTIGMAATVRALSEGGRDDVLWDLLQEYEQPSYGYFLQSTPAA